MIPNKIFDNKSEVHSKTKQFIGYNLTICWDYLTLALSLVLPFVAIIMLAVSHQHFIKETAWILWAVWIVALFINIITSHFVEQYVVKFQAQAVNSQPDRKGLVFALISLNFGVFFLIYNKLPSEQKIHFREPFEIKQKKAKEKSKTNEKSKSKK